MTAQQNTSPYGGLCQFIFADGRQCCMPGLPSLNHFCRSHAALNRRHATVEEDLSCELSELFSGPESHLDVLHALERVFKAFAANRISARRAATFGYLGQLIMFAKGKSEDLSKRELHDMYNAMSGVLRATYTHRRKPSAPAATPAPSSAPSPNAPDPSPNNNHHPSQ